MAYNANGSILKYLRNGNYNSSLSTLSEMDSLTYYYVDGSNKLDHVLDGLSNTHTTDIADIETQGAGNYDYDEIDNLLKDVTEGIDANDITWNVYGKIASITKTVGILTTSIDYTYDASGNRVTRSCQMLQM